ncbi:hypothetical protein DH2020_024873 [Rehmannia glutinosa]|uniref:SMP domain-containing protein n=1 Tax=Rehmannia glutinosa TaxID=99300 RepID=A0ABR0W237_REHGL
MSQEQPKSQQDPVKYWDIFQVQKGGPAAVMQSAADVNVRRGVLRRDDVTTATRQHGVSISEEDVGGQRVFTEAVGGEVVGRYVVAKQKEETIDPPLSALNPIVVTIGQALESVALYVGDKPVDESDAAAIQALESRATGLNKVIPGGVSSKLSLQPNIMLVPWQKTKR